jgi:hypothetical protein
MAVLGSPCTTTNDPEVAFLGEDGAVHAEDLDLVDEV